MWYCFEYFVVVFEGSGFVVVFLVGFEDYLGDIMGICLMGGDYFGIFGCIVM